MKENNHFPERRQYPRFSVRYFAAIHFKDETFYASVSDISQGGMEIIFQEELQTNEILNLKTRFTLFGTERHDVHMKAKVVMVQGIGIEKIYRCGLEITDISEEDNEKLIENIQ